MEVEEEGVKCEQLERVVISNNEEKFFQVEVQLPPWEKEELIDFLKKKHQRIFIERLRSPRGGSELHLSPFKHQSIYPPPKATTPVLIQGTF